MDNGAKRKARQKDKRSMEEKRKGKKSVLVQVEQLIAK
jgi:hypothetical protein